MIIHAYEKRVPFTIGVDQKSRGISTVGGWAAIGGRLAKSASVVFSRSVRAAVLVFHILSRYLEWARARLEVGLLLHFLLGRFASICSRLRPN